jgi:DNA processing protein
MAREPGVTETEFSLWDELPLEDVAMAPVSAGPAPDWQPNAEAQVPEPELRSRLLALLGPTPVMIDDLVREMGGQPRHVQMALMELELDGLVQRHAGQRVALTSGS